MEPRSTYDLKRIFNEAAELNGESRQRYLDAACAGDGLVRSEVEALLAAADADADEDILGWGSIGELLFAGTKEPSVFGAGDLISDSFRIVRLIGSGGMGEVYEAEDLRLGGRVAIKTLRSSLLRLPGFTARFRREVQLARRVTHRNVCRIYDLGRDRVKEEDVVFLTMELLPGETLAEYVKGGPLPPAEVKSLARQIVSGLAALHAADIVHRDVKPSNILIEGTGPTRRLVITDFGLAHPVSITDAGETLSHTGQVMGTPAYAAPEQLSGKKLGPTADIYSLGLVMYEMLTGRKPFEGDTAFDIAAKKLTGKVQPPSKYARISPAWDTLILRCLETNAGDRFADTAELLQSLEAIDETWNGQPAGRLGRILASRAATGLRRPALLMAAAAITAAVSVQSTDAGAPLRRRGCEWMPGSNIFCDLPAIKDIAVFPFAVVGDTAEEKALAEGWARHIRDSFHRLALDPEKVCVHLRNDRLSEGVQLVLEGTVESRGGALTFTATVKENAAAALGSKPLVLRRIKLTSRLRSATELEIRPLEELARALEVRYDQPTWEAWVKRNPKFATSALAQLRGLGYLASGKYQSAAEEFDSVLDPTRDFASPAAHVGLADAYRLLYTVTHDPAWEVRARRAYERALPLDRDFGFAGAERGLGELDRVAGRNHDAIEHYAAAMKQWPLDHALQKSLTNAYEAAGKMADAETVLREAATRMPRCWQPLNALGALYSRQSKLRESERTYLELIRLAPDNGSAYHNLAFDYMKMGRYDDAINMASKSIEVRPYPMAYATLGRAYLNRGCTSDALLNVQKAVELDPNYSILWSTLSDSLEVAGRAKDALLAAQRSVDLARAGLAVSPSDSATRARYALNLARIGQVQDAIREAKLAVEQSPSNQQVLPIAADALERSGKREEAFAIVAMLLRSGLSVHEIEASIGLKPLRRDPRYSRLLSQLGLNPAADPGGLTPQTSECPSWKVPGKGLEYN